MCGCLLREKRWCGSRFTTETSFLASLVFALPRGSCSAVLVWVCEQTFSTGRCAFLPSWVFECGCALRRSCLWVAHSLFGNRVSGPRSSSQHGLCAGFWLFFLAPDFVVLGCCDRSCGHGVADSALWYLGGFIAFGQPFCWHRPPFFARLCVQFAWQSFWGFLDFVLPRCSTAIIKLYLFPALGLSSSTATNDKVSRPPLRPPQ